MYYIVYTPEASEEVHEHSYTPEVTQKPTCTEQGVITYSCSCGDSYTETADAEGHSWVTDDTGRMTCSSCGEIDDSNVDNTPENGDDENNNNENENENENGNNEESSPKRENFFTRLINGIVNFFTSIFRAIGKLFGM